MLLYLSNPLIQEYMEVYTQRKLLETKMDDGKISDFSLDVDGTLYLSAESIDEDEWPMIRYNEITLEMKLKGLGTAEVLEKLCCECFQ